MAIKSRYSSLGKLSLEGLYASFIVLSPRDKLIASVVGGLLILLIIIFPLSMVSGKIASLKKGVLHSQEKLYQVADKVAEYQAHQAEITALERKIGRGARSMTSLIESMATQSNLKNNIDALKEKPVIPGELFVEAPVELKLKNVTLESLIAFLYRLETHPQSLMRVRKLQIKPRYANRNYLEVTMEVAGISLRGEGEGEEGEEG